MENLHDHGVSHGAQEPRKAQTDVPNLVAAFKDDLSEVSKSNRPQPHSGSCISHSKKPWSSNALNTELD